MRVGGTGRNVVRPLAWAAVLVAAGVAGCALMFGEQVFSPGNRAVLHMVDQRTGEIWACPQGGCQLND